MGGLLPETGKGDLYSNSGDPTFITFQHQGLRSRVVGAEIGRCGLVDGDMGRVELHQERGLIVVVAV